MGLFSLPAKNDYVSGPHHTHVKVTFENLCQSLNDERYVDGVDPESLVDTVNDVYEWLMGLSKGKAIRLPAPATEPDDRHRTLWPEGSVVKTRSRRDSARSDRSSVTSGGHRVEGLSRQYTSSRASSVTSSKYAPIMGTFAEDDDAPVRGFRNININDIPAKNYAPRRESQPARNKEPRTPFFEDAEVPDQSRRQQSAATQKHASKQPAQRFAED